MHDTNASDRVTIADIGVGHGRVVLVIAAHADDATLFCGGTIARWADEGWKVVVVRVTDDRWDSVGVSEAETLRRAHTEFEAAMAVLGVAETEHWGWPTDTLGDASELRLREQVIRAIRTHQPHTIVTHDPHSGTGEDNEDHWLVASAVAEAIWCAQFDKHHPEHFAEGLEVHGVFERWYFGRPVAYVTDVVEISATLDRLIAAALCQELPLRNLIHQLRLQARTGGWRVPALDDSQHGSIAPIIELLLRSRSTEAGARYGLVAAEPFRVERFGGLMALLDAFGERLEHDT